MMYRARVCHVPLCVQMPLMLGESCGRGHHKFRACVERTRNGDKCIRTKAHKRPGEERKPACCGTWRRISPTFTFDESLPTAVSMHGSTGSFEFLTEWSASKPKCVWLQASYLLKKSCFSNTHTHTTKLNFVIVVGVVTLKAIPFSFCQAPLSVLIQHMMRPISRGHRLTKLKKRNAENKGARGVNWNTNTIR